MAVLFVNEIRNREEKRPPSENSDKISDKFYHIFYNALTLFNFVKYMYQVRKASGHEFVSYGYRLLKF